MIKKFFMRKLMERQLKSLPASQREQIMAAFEKNPGLFERIAKDVQAETKKGKDQMAAMMSVMPKYRKELAEAMGASAQVRQQFNPNGSIRK